MARVKLRVILVVLSILSFLSVSVAGYVTFRSLRDSAYKESEKDSALHAERIRNGVSSFLAGNLKTAHALAGLKEIGEVLSRPRGPSLARANAVLDHFRNALAADVCYVMDRDGTTVASSNRNAPDSFVGNNFSFRPYWKQAIRGTPSTYMALGVTSNVRGVYFSHPVYGDPAAPPVGVAVIKVSTGTIEREFGQGGEGIVLLADPKGIVFASNRKDWLYRSLQTLTQEDVEEVARSQQFGSGPWEWSGLSILGDGTARDGSGRAYRFSRLDVSTYPGWSVVYLSDLRAVSRKISAPLFRVTGPILLALCFLIGLSVFFLYRRASDDIVRRKAAEEALLEAQKQLTRHSGELERQVKERTRRFTNILRHTPAVVYVKDREGRYTYVNPRFTELFGVRNAEVRGKTDFDVFPYEFAHAFRENDRRVLAGRTPIQVEETFPRAGGTRVYLSNRFPIYDDEGIPTALCGISTDISEIKRAEDQLRRLSDSIIAGQEKERAAVARELHDEFGQVLTALGLDAAWLRDRMRDADPEASRQAQAMCGVIDKAIDERALSGTLVVRGKGMLEVSATGANSAMGRLAGMLSGIESEKTPLEKRLDVFGMQIARWVGALAVTLIVVGVAAEGLGRFEEMVLFAVALAVAAVPEGMPAVVTLTLALGVQRMARRKAVVRRLSAVEALGSVTVIATDKTGTLTENRMRVHELLSERRHEALQAMALANDAEPDAAAGDPLEIGLLAFAREQGIDIHALRASHPRVSQRVFDSSWKFMRVTIDNGHELQSLLKGAPEVLLGRCNLDPAARDHWLARAEAAANDGYRVLALAQGVGEAESDLQLLGLILLWDPARAEVADAMRTVRKAGVRVIMITGDHPGTARAVARQIGMEHEHVVTGAEIDALDSAQLRNIARDTTVFARVSAEHKLRLIEALQANGEIVAMTGDGVNDAPALKRADVGIAMGQRGSDVSREVADLVLLDDNFATIVGAIEEGRGIYENIQKFIRFLFSTNVALVILVVGGAILAYAQNLREDSGMLLLPLTAIQLLWINFIADGPPALALALDRNASLMQRPPRSPSSPLLDTASLRFVFSTGLIKAAAGLSLLIWLPMLGYGASVARTAVFLFEASAQLVFAYPARRIAQAPASNMLLNAIVALSLLVQAATLMLPALREMLALHPLDLRALAIVATAVLAAWLIAEWLNHRLRMHAAHEAALP